MCTKHGLYAILKIFCHKDLCSMLNRFRLFSFKMNDKMSAHFESGGHGPLVKVPFLTASTLLLLNKGPLLFSLMVCLHSTLLFLINLSKKSNLWCFLHLQPATWHWVINFNELIENMVSHSLQINCYVTDFSIN